MGKPTGFLEYTRETPKPIPVKDRIKNYKEFYAPFSQTKTFQQAARCMDCGTPFCHMGCPLGNLIPDFNDAVYHKDFKRAYEILSTTNSFPEFTGRICPAPCEGSCVLGIHEPPTAIEHIEKSIAEEAFKNGYIQPKLPEKLSGKKVAIIGSGPAGLAAADQLNKAGHWVVVYERDEKPGGLLRYGIPDFKLEGEIVDRRVNVMEQQGIFFKTNANVGENVPLSYIMSAFDAVLIATGSTIPRNLEVKGRECKGAHYAMEFLTQQNRRVDGQEIPAEQSIMAKDKHVIVIGGGDTGSDCVGTSIRHGAKSVTQLEIMPKPSEERTESNPWPEWPLILRTSSSHDEGCERKWSILTKEIIGDDKGNVKAIKVVDIEWSKAAPGQRPQFKEIEGSERELKADLILLAMGFLHTQQDGLLKELGVEFDQRGNIQCNNYKTSVEKVFAAGDTRRGQSLVVWALTEGREAAREIDAFLTGKKSELETKNKSIFDVSEL